MKEEDKELLFREFCARLPYGIKYNYDDCVGCNYVARRLDAIAQSVDEFPIWDCKPYFRPLSSMTEEEMRELRGMCDFLKEEYDKYLSCDSSIDVDVIDWLNEHRFYYRTEYDKTMIERGLALVAPKDMYVQP